MKILMVYPHFPPTFWSFKYVLKYISKKAVYPPLGLLTVAAMLPREWQIRLVDLNVKRLRDKDIAWADMVWVSSMLIQKSSALKVMERCRLMGKKIVAGGPLFSSSPDEYLSSVDHLFVGEAEGTMPHFLADLAAGRAQKVYQGGTFPDLALTPSPRWDLIKIDQYATLMLQYSRGCPFNCEFCDVTSLFGFVPRVKTPSAFIAELEAIYKLGWRGNLFVVDDNFIGHKRAIKELLPTVISWMKERYYPFDLFTEVSINLAEDDELIDLMRKAGFTGVFIGLETPDEDSLKECSKFQNCGLDVKQAINKLQQAGFQVSGGYIVGFDSDDERIFARQMKFIQETGVVTAMVGLLNALPNTRLWHRLQGESRLAANSTGDNTDGTINFVPRMDRETLIKGYQNLVSNLYSHKHYYERILTFLKEYRPSRPARFDYRRFKAFLKSLLYLGILGNGRTQWYYWKLFFRALWRHRQAFPEAMTMMVYGHHFRKIARRLAKKNAKWPQTGAAAG